MTRVWANRQQTLFSDMTRVWANRQHTTFSDTTRANRQQTTFSDIYLREMNISFNIYCIIKFGLFIVIVPLEHDKYFIDKELQQTN